MRKVLHSTNSTTVLARDTSSPEHGEMFACARGSLSATMPGRPTAATDIAMNAGGSRERFLSPRNANEFIGTGIRAMAKGLVDPCLAWGSED